LPAEALEAEAAVRGNDITGIVLTVILIGLCWTAALVIKKKKLFSPHSVEVARKIVHIGVSNFAFFYLYIFETWYVPFSGLVVFACINLWIELNTGSRRSWGTVEYPLVIALLVLLVRFGIGSRIALVCALLGMGYGDGLAAIVGLYAGKVHMPGSTRKTVAGSLTVFTAVFLVCCTMSGLGLGFCLLTAALTMLAEAYTPWNLDNISVPVLIFVLTGVLF